MKQDSIYISPDLRAAIVMEQEREQLKYPKISFSSICVMLLGQAINERKRLREKNAKKGNSKD